MLYFLSLFLHFPLTVKFTSMASSSPSLPTVPLAHQWLTCPLTQWLF
jgi:hypothetical protein